MSLITVTVAEGRRAFVPGETIQGTASWRLDARPDAAEVRLFYFTRGKGNEDVEVVSTVRYEAPEVAADERFAFQAPPAPHSFSGRLITLVWAVELVIEPEELADRVELVIAPEGREISIGPVAP